jgi:hypothetical protein
VHQKAWAATRNERVVLFRVRWLHQDGRLDIVKDKRLSILPKGLITNVMSTSDLADDLLDQLATCRLDVCLGALQLALFHH